MGKVKDGISVSTPSKPSKGKGGGSPRGLFVLVPGEPDPRRSLQADAGVVRAGVHRHRAGRGRRRRGVEDFGIDARVHAALAVRAARRLRGSAGLGAFFGSCIFRRLPSF